MKSELEEISLAFSSLYAGAIDYRSAGAKGTSGTMTAPEKIAEKRHIDIVHAIERLPTKAKNWILYIYTVPAEDVTIELKRSILHTLFDYQISAYGSKLKIPRSWENDTFLSDKKKRAIKFMVECVKNGKQITGEGISEQVGLNSRQCTREGRPWGDFKDVINQQMYAWEKLAINAVRALDEEAA